MTHTTISITAGKESAELSVYILDSSPEIAISKRPLVLICPGGGYRRVSDREAEPIAIKMNSMGFHAAVLRYSVAPHLYPQSLIELAKSVALLRGKANDWNIDAQKIIVAGFSAGGHLAGCLGAFWNNRKVADLAGVTINEIQPNGLILGYPVITTGVFAPKGCFENLWGTSPSSALQQLLSLEHQVTKTMPPTFLWHTYTDTTVPVENTLLFATALRQADIPFELHIYPQGAHGLSLATEQTEAPDRPTSKQIECSNWIDMAGRWIKSL